MKQPRPCLNCQDRKERCHATCKRGIEQDKQHAQRLNTIREQRDIELQYRDYCIKNHERLRRSHVTA